MIHIIRRKTSKKFKLSIDLFYDGVNALSRYRMKKQNDSIYFLKKKQNMTIDFQNLPYSQRENRFPNASISAKKVSVFVYLLKKQNFSTDSKIFPHVRLKNRFKGFQKQAKRFRILFLSIDISKEEGKRGSTDSPIV